MFVWLKAEDDVSSLTVLVDAQVVHAYAGNRELLATTHDKLRVEAEMSEN
jgi:hypothetical protein